ncbi:hypothetical protein [Streptomyces sp. F001]|uniref:hypothetical protein n=1 Tax=Streptomyces sp. F001 TaxID=1510026 RepID=UPI001F0E38C8|nr:hypothetical protein [Streptomyces sp. F001]
MASAASAPPTPGNLKRIVAASLIGTTIGASAVTPALTYSLFWRGFTRTGLLATLYGGAACALVLMVFSKAVSGTPSAVFPDADFALFPMQSTGLVSVPFGYLAGWLGSRPDHWHRAAASLENRRLYEESEARLLAAAPEAARQARFDGTMP